MATIPSRISWDSPRFASRAGSRQADTRRSIKQQFVVGHRSSGTPTHYTWRRVTQRPISEGRDQPEDEHAQQQARLDLSVLRRAQKSLEELQLGLYRSVRQQLYFELSAQELALAILTTSTTSPSPSPSAQIASFPPVTTPTVPSSSLSSSPFKSTRPVLVKCTMSRKCNFLHLHFLLHIVFTILHIENERSNTGPCVLQPSFCDWPDEYSPHRNQHPSGWRGVS